MDMARAFIISLTDIHNGAKQRTPQIQTFLDFVNNSTSRFLIAALKINYRHGSCQDKTALMNDKAISLSSAQIFASD